MAHALATQVFVRGDDGLLAPAIILSPAMGLAAVPALGRYYKVRSNGKTFVVNDRRIARAGQRGATWTPPAFIARDLSLEDPR